MFDVLFAQVIIDMRYVLIRMNSLGNVEIVVATTQLAFKTLQQIRAKDNVSYRDALTRQKQLTQASTASYNKQDVINNRIKENGLNTSAHMPRVATSTTTAIGLGANIAKVEVGTETDCEASTETVIEASIISIVEKTLAKHTSENFMTEQLAACLLEIFCTIDLANTLKKKCTIVTKVFDYHCSRKISTNVLDDKLSKVLTNGGQPRASSCSRKASGKGNGKR